MKTINKLFIILLAITFFTPGLSAQTARDIMVEVDKVSRESSSSSVQKMKLSTCKYGVVKKKIYLSK